MIPFHKSSEFELIAEKFSKRINSALLDAFSSLKMHYSEKYLIKILEKSGLGGIIGLVNQMNIDGEISNAITTNLVNAVSEGGRFILGSLPTDSLLGNFTFSLLDPNTINSLNRHNAALVTAISNNTRTAIVNTVRRNIIAGNSPIKIAREFRDVIGLTDNQELAIERFKQNLEEGKLTPLNNELRDKRFDGTIKQIAEGKAVSQDKIDKMVERYREKYIKYRSETIARTESMRALSMGEYFSLKQAQQQGKLNPNLRRFWIATADERTRNWHINIPIINKDGVSVDSPFNTTLGPLMFPRDPSALPANTINCRCRIKYEILKGDKALKVNLPEIKPKVTVNTPKVRIGKPKIHRIPSLKDKVPAFYSTQEAETWIGERIPDVAFSFEEMDVKALNSVVKELKDLADRFPSVIRETKYIGTDSISSNAELRLNKILPKEGDYRFSEFKKYVNNEFPIDRRVDASCWRNEGWESIIFNKESFKDISKLNGILKEEMKSGWIAKKTGSIEGIVRHEFAHNIDNYIKNKLSLKYFKDSEISIENLRVKLLREIKEEIGDIEKFSRYGATNDSELIAECFSSYNSGNPAYVKATKKIDTFFNKIQKAIKKQELIEYKNLEK